MPTPKQIASRNHYIKNREHLLALRKQRYQKTKAVELARNKTWMETHREQRREWLSGWNKLNREKRNRQQQERRLLHREEINSNNRARYPLVADARRAAQKRWRKKNPEQTRKRLQEWKVRNRKQYNEYRRIAYHSMTDHQRLIRKQRLSAWHQRNPGYMSAYRDKRKRAMGITTVRFDLIVKWMSAVRSKPFTVCYYCRRVRSSLDIHFDHVVPLSKGGAHEVGNLCVSCESCNCSKGARRISQWPQIPEPMLDL